MEWFHGGGGRVLTTKSGGTFKNYEHSAVQRRIEIREISTCTSEKKIDGICQSFSTRKNRIDV